MKKSLLAGFAISMCITSIQAAPSNQALFERLMKLEQKLADQEKLEEQIQDLKEEILDLKEVQEDAASEAPVKSFTGGLTFGGYVDMEFHNRSGSNSKFDQHRFIFDISADLSEKVKFVSELEFEHAASSSSIGMEQAYIDYSINEKAGFRAGQILVPIGRLNYLHDAPMLQLTERPKLLKEIVPSTWYDAGAGFFGEFGSEKHPISYELYTMNGMSDSKYNLDSGTGFRSLRRKGKEKTENNNSKAFTGRFGFSVGEETQIGLSFYRANVGQYAAPVGTADAVLVGDRDMTMNAIDIEHPINDRLDFQGEYVWGDIDANMTTGVAAYDFKGWYAQVNYILDKNEKYRAILRLGAEDTAKGMDNKGDIEETVLGFNYRPNSSSVYKVEYHWEDTNVNTTSKASNDGFVFSVATYF
ncbi:OprO/OprP family phosphate-selective porin [bacterium]|nr:OprO/OprP family phosphate-selective porin [bacterium]